MNYQDERDKIIEFLKAVSDNGDECEAYNVMCFYGGCDVRGGDVRLVVNGIVDMLESEGADLDKMILEFKEHTKKIVATEGECENE